MPTPSVAKNAQPGFYRSGTFKVQPNQAMANPSLVHYSGHNKLSALLAGPDFSLMGKAADFLAGLVELTVPDGYEDEAGFHYLPARTGVSRPPKDGPVWLGEYI